MDRRQTAFWGWSREDWAAVVRASDAGFRQHAMAVAYLLAGVHDVHAPFVKFKRRVFAVKVFGRAPVDDAAVPGTDEILPKDAVCLLDVPAHKTGRAFAKPVDRAVGEAIAAWERVRPAQPP